MPRVVVIVVIDTCVLFPASIRDTFLRANDAGLYTLWLTVNILEELYSVLVNKNVMSEEKARKLVETIKKKFARSLITISEQQIASMPVNEKDRHVLAAAVASGAKVIVTQNLKDFPAHLLDPFGIKAQSPDEFLTRLFRDYEERMTRLIIEQAADLRKSPKTALDVLDTLKQHAPGFANLVRSRLQCENIIYL